MIADARYLPFKTSSIDGVYSSHCIEHIQDQLSVISELWRVCKNNAIIHLQVPHFSNPSYYDDLTHSHRYSTRSFEHYDHDLIHLTEHPNYLPDVNIKLIYSRLEYWPKRITDRKSLFRSFLIRFFATLFNYFANSNKFLCERIWCNWVGGFFEVEYEFKVLKMEGIS